MEKWEPGPRPRGLDPHPDSGTMATVSSGGWRGWASKGHGQTEGDGQRQVTASILSQGSRGLTHCQGRGKGEPMEMGQGGGWGCAESSSREARRGAVRAVGAGNPPPPRGGGMVLTHDSTPKNKNWRKRKDGMIKSFWSSYKKILQEKKTL